MPPLVGEQYLIDCFIQGQSVQALWDSESPKEDTTLIFEPDVNPRWTEGLELCDTLVKVTKGAKLSITISVQNPTNHDVVLAGRTVIGTVQQTQAVYPTSILEGSRPPPPAKMNHIRVEKNQTTTDAWDQPVNLTHLSEPEREIAHKMLREESASFSKSDKDIGCIEKLVYPLKTLRL